MTTEWQLRHLAEIEPGRPAAPGEPAYLAMTALIFDRWLDVTRFEREQHVHGGRGCGPPECEVCTATALRAVLSACNRLRRHLRKAPPQSGRPGACDWRTMLSWVRAPELTGTPVAIVRSGLYWGLPDDHPVLPLAHAVAAQLLPSQPRPGDARGSRRLREAVTELRRSARAYQRIWDAHPEQGFLAAPALAPVRDRHPRGCALLAAVLRAVEAGDHQPYRTVLVEAGSRPGDEAALRALIGELLDAPVSADWFLRNVDCRQTYNLNRLLVQRRDTCGTGVAIY
jgi:hypothetical protein